MLFLVFLALFVFGVGLYYSFRLIRQLGGVNMALTASAGTMLLALALGVALAVITTSSLWSILAGVPLMIIVIAAGVYTARFAEKPALGLPLVSYRIAAVLALPLLAGWIAYMFVGPGYYREFNRIKAGLAAIPGVQVLEVAGHRDLTFEDIFARLLVEGKGEIHVLGLTNESLTDTRHLQVTRVGPYRFGRTRWAYRPEFDDLGGRMVWRKSGGGGLDLGRDGDFGPNGKLAGRLEPRLRNVQDLVSHYDEIVAAAEAMQQEELSFRNADGSMLTISVKPARTSRKNN